MNLTLSVLFWLVEGLASAPLYRQLCFRHAVRIALEEEGQLRVQIDGYTEGEHRNPPACVRCSQEGTEAVGRKTEQ